MPAALKSPNTLLYRPGRSAALLRGVGGGGQRASREGEPSRLHRALYRGTPASAARDCAAAPPASSCCRSGWVLTGRLRITETWATSFALGYEGQRG